MLERPSPFHVIPRSPRLADCVWPVAPVTTTGRFARPRNASMVSAKSRPVRRPARQALHWAEPRVRPYESIAHERQIYMSDLTACVRFRIVQQPAGWAKATEYRARCSFPAPGSSAADTSACRCVPPRRPSALRAQRSAVRLRPPMGGGRLQIPTSGCIAAARRWHSTYPRCSPPLRPSHHDAAEHPVQQRFELLGPDFLQLRLLPPPFPRCGSVPAPAAPGRALDICPRHIP